MKKLFALLFAVMLFTACAFAEGAPADDVEITFRGFEWYAPFSEVDPVLAEIVNYDSVGVVSIPNEKIDSINSAARPGMYSEDAVENAGVVGFYGNVEVAGYSVLAELYYMYPIVDGAVIRETESAELYTAIYFFDEVADPNAVYEDLNEKLVGIYGVGQDKTTEWHQSGTYWEDTNGNAIWLVVDDDCTEVMLVYAAGEHIDRLAALETQIEIDALKSEEESRKENAGNDTGL